MFASAPKCSASSYCLRERKEQQKGEQKKVANVFFSTASAHEWIHHTQRDTLNGKPFANSPWIEKKEIRNSWCDWCVIPFLFSFLLDELIRNLRHKSEFNSRFRNVPSLVAKICLFYDVCGWLRRNFLCSPHFASRSKTDKGYHLYVNRTRMDRSKERKCSTQMESSKLGVMMTEDCKCWNVLQGETSPTTHDELMSESPSFPHSAAFPVSFRWRSIIHLWFFISPFSRDLRRYFHFARLGEWWIFVKIRLFFFCAREDILINQKMEQIDDANCCHLSERKKEKRMKKRGTGRVLFFIGARVEKPLKIYIYSA